MNDGEFKTYEAGYEAGLRWRDEWEAGLKRGLPGGPWVSSYRRPSDGAWVSDPQSLRENEAWRRGWEEGYQRKQLLKVIGCWSLVPDTDLAGGHGEGPL